MKLLVTGGSGFLGKRVAAHFAGLGWNVLTPGHKELDITDEAAVLMAEFDFDFPLAEDGSIL